MKIFYQPHPNIKPIIKDLRDCKGYMTHINNFTLISLPIELAISLPYTNTLETIDDRYLERELEKRNVERVDLTVEFILQFDYDRALSDSGDRSWSSRIKVEVNELDGHKVERQSILIDKLDSRYAEAFMRACPQDDFTAIGDIDEFNWCNIVRIVSDDEAEQLEQERAESMYFQ